MKKLNVGDKLYMVTNNGYLGRNIKVKGYEVEVVKVGRKYFKVKRIESQGLYTFYVENWRLKTDFVPYVRLYECKEEYNDVERKLKFFKVFKREFQFMDEKRFSSQQLREAAKILNIDLEEED